MALHFVCGRAHSGKSTYLNDIIKSKINNGQKIMLIVPEQFTHIAESRLLSSVGKIMDGYIEISSFKRFADRTRALCADLRRNIISNTGRSLVVSELLEKLNLDYYKNSASFPGFTDVCLDSVSEMKKYNLTPDDISKMIDSTDNELLKLKLADMKKIYEAYEQNIHKAYIDTDDVLDILAGQLAAGGLYDDFVFFFDEFTSFIPQERRIIAELIKSVDVYVSLCMQRGNSSGLFLPCEATYRQLGDLCRKNGVNSDTTWLDESYYVSDALRFAEKNLFAYPTVEYEPDQDDISVVRAKNPYAEVDETARSIVSLVRDKNYRYRDIAVICSDIDSYNGIFKNVFTDYSLPYFIDAKTDVLSHHIVLFVLNILDVYLDGYTYESVFNFLKSGFNSLSAASVALLENFILKTNITKNSWLDDDRWKTLLGAYRADDGDKKIISDIREEYILPLAAFHDRIKGRNTVIYIAAELYKYLVSVGLDKTVAQYVDQFRENGDNTRAKQYESVWNVIVRVLEEIADVLGDKNASVKNFRKYLYVAFMHQKIGIIPTSLDEIMIGDIVRTRTEKVRALFVVGANEGKFPLAVKDDLILSDRDKFALAEIGFELPNTSAVQAFCNQFLIYSVFAMPTERLYVSYCNADSEFATMSPSFSVGRLKKMFGRIEHEDFSGDYSSIELVGSAAVTKDNFAAILRMTDRGEETAPLWKSVYAYYMREDPGVIDRIKNFSNKSNVAERIDRGIMKKHIGDEMYSTVTRLQKYSACRYSYFLAYVLSLRERQISDLRSVDVGSIAHGLIEKICRNMDAENIGFDSVPDGYFKNVIDAAVDECIENIGKTAADLTKRQLYAVQRLKNVLLKCFEMIRRQFTESKFEPIGYEIVFSDENIGCIEIGLPNGEKLKLTGKIDRADAYDAADGRYIRIIDYKTGHKMFNLNDAVYGIDIQLPVYLDALVGISEKNKYGGAFFFTLDDFMLDADHDVPDEKIAEKRDTAMKLKGIIIDRKDVLDAFEKSAVAHNSGKTSDEQFRTLGKYLKKTIADAWVSLSDGNIAMNPYLRAGEKPCTYCPYHSVCRFDESQPGNSYNRLVSMRGEQTWKYIKGELSDVDE